MNAKNIARALALGILLTAGVASAQTTDVTTDASVTPGVANTGAGGNSAANMILLASSAVVAIGGTAYLARKHAN